MDQQKRVIVFDYDDTLTLDTEQRKQDFFVSIFEDLEVELSGVRDFVRSHRGISRREKISGILDVLAGAGYIHDPQSHLERYLERFGQLVEEMTVKAELRPGAEEALRTLQADHSLYLLSANPQEALERIVERRGWNPFFRGIYGTSISSKIEQLGTILLREGIHPTRVIVVGDGMSDLHAAEAHGCRFIGVRGALTTFSSDTDVTFPILEEFFSLPTVLADLVKGG